MAPISTSVSEIFIETIHLVARGKGPEFTTGEPYRGAGGNVGKAKKKGPPKKTIGIAVGCVLGGLLLLYFAVKLYCSWQRKRKGRPAASETRPRGFFGALFRRKKNREADEESEVARKTEEQPGSVPVAQEKYAQHDEDANSESTLQTAHQTEKMRSNSETTLQGQRESLEKTTENVDRNDTRNSKDTTTDDEPYSMVREAERAMEQGKC